MATHRGWKLIVPVVRCRSCSAPKSQVDGNFKPPQLVTKDDPLWPLVPWCKGSDGASGCRPCRPSISKKWRLRTLKKVPDIMSINVVYCLIGFQRIDGCLLKSTFPSEDQQKKGLCGLSRCDHVSMATVSISTTLLCSLWLVATRRWLTLPPSEIYMFMRLVSRSCIMEQTPDATQSNWLVTFWQLVSKCRHHMTSHEQISSFSFVSISEYSILRSSTFGSSRLTIHKYDI